MISNQSNIVSVCQGLLLLLVLIGVPIDVHSQADRKVEDVLEKYDILNPKLVRTYETSRDTIRAHKIAMETIWKSISELRNEINRQSVLRGSANMGFFADHSDLQNDQRLQLAFSIQRGSYPGEFELASDLILDYKQGKLSEKVSTVSLSYDYNLKYWLESFVFVQRFSDTYLSIDQRYEVGAGIIFGNWLKKADLRKESEIKLKSEHYPTDTASVKATSWYRIYEKRMKPTYKQDFLAGIASDFSSIESTIEDAVNSQYKQNSWIRPALLLGVLAEIEQPAILSADSCLHNGEWIKFDTTRISKPFDSRTVWRIYMRPTLELRPTKDWRIRVNPYWKVRLPLLNKNLSGSEVEDYRWDIYVTNTVKIPLKGLQRNKSIDIGMTYRFHYDKNPHGFETPEGYVVYARKRHHLVRFSFGITF